MRCASAAELALRRHVAALKHARLLHHRSVAHFAYHFVHLFNLCSQVVQALGAEAAWCGASLPGHSPALPLGLLGALLGKLEKPFKQRLGVAMAGPAGEMCVVHVVWQGKQGVEQAGCSCLSSDWGPATWKPALLCCSSHAALLQPPADPYLARLPLTAGSVLPLEHLEQVQAAAADFAAAVFTALGGGGSASAGGSGALTPASFAAAQQRILAPTEEALLRYGERELAYLSAELARVAAQGELGTRCCCAAADTWHTQAALCHPACPAANPVHTAQGNRSSPFCTSHPAGTAVAGSEGGAAALESSIAPALAACEAALGRCLKLTAGTGLPALAAAVDRAVQQYVAALQAAVAGLRGSLADGSASGDADVAAEGAEAVLPLLTVASQLVQRLALLEASLRTAVAEVAPQLLQGGNGEGAGSGAAANGGASAAAQLPSAAELRLQAQPALRQQLTAFAANAASGAQLLPLARAAAAEMEQQACSFVFC